MYRRNVHTSLAETLYATKLYHHYVNNCRQDPADFRIMELSNAVFHAIRMAHENFNPALKNVQDQESRRSPHFDLFWCDRHCIHVKRHFRPAWNAHWFVVEGLCHLSGQSADVAACWVVPIKGADFLQRCGWKMILNEFLTFLFFIVCISSYFVFALLQQKAVK